VNDYLHIHSKVKLTTIEERKMIIKEKKMKISKMYRVDSAPQEPKSAVRGLLQRVGLTVLASALVIGAASFVAAGDARNGTTRAAPPITGVIGKVQSFTGSSLDIQTPSGVVHVAVKQPLTTYKQIPSDLSHVTSASYVGVASVQQADGTQIAKQIFIFPPELSGAAEGSVLTDPPGATTHSRMTNGSVSRPAISHSRMTNGTVQKGGGTTLVVRYQDGAQTISVPPDVPVTEVAPVKVTFVEGDTVYATTDKQPDGTLVTNKIFLFILATSPNTKQ
jgi:hypothetical protein